MPTHHKGQNSGVGVIRALRAQRALASAPPLLSLTCWEMDAEAIGQEIFWAGKPCLVRASCGPQPL